MGLIGIIVYFVSVIMASGYESVLVFRDAN